MRKCSKLIIPLLIISMMLSCFGIAAADVSDEYVEVIFGKPDRLTNAKFVLGGWELVERDGRSGRRTNVATKSGELNYYDIDIDDDFMFNLEDGTPIEVTVEYFDEGKGGFQLQYDSHHTADSRFKNFNRTEITYLENTGEWRSKTFHIEDACFANRTDRMDLRITSYLQGKGWSTENIILGSVKVTWADYISPIDFEGTYTDMTGNIHSPNDEVVFNYTSRNKIETAMNAKYIYNVYTGSGELIETVTHEEKLDAKETSTGRIKLTNPVVYDIYKVVIDTEVSMVDNPEKVYKNTINTEFSVSIIHDGSAANPGYGANTLTLHYGRGNPEDTGEVVRKNGMTWIRVESLWREVELEKGKLKMPEVDMYNIRSLHEQGFKLLFTCAYYNQFYDNGETPSSDEAIEGFANYCAFVAKETRGMIDHFEIWNEYNVTNFNNKMYGGDVYAKMLKAAYKALKEVDPNIKVVGIDCSGVELDFIRKVLENGGGEYMDILSVHPYPSSRTMYDEREMIERTEGLRKLMEEFDIGDMPVWFTETGFSTWNGGYTMQRQIDASVMMNAVVEAYDLCDVFMMYCFYDAADFNQREDNWGFVHMWEPDGRGNVPNGAKPSFLAMSAANYLTGSAEFKSVIEDDLYYGFHFYNKRLGKDILLLNASLIKEPAYREYDLGVSSVEVYDQYGNKVRNITSDNGVYSFQVSPHPYYIIGNFTKFEKAASPASVSADAPVKTAAAGESVSFEFTKAVDKNLIVEAVGAEGVTIAQNNGFSGDMAEVTIATGQDMQDGTELDFYVTIRDEGGNEYYRESHKVVITSPVSISITSEQAVEDSFTHWRAKVVVTNETLSENLSGKVSVAAPEDVAQISKERSFENLQPGKSVTFLYNLPERITKRVVRLSVDTALAGGYKTTSEGVLDFGTALYAYNKPIIDGVVSVGEWNGSWIGADTIDDWIDISTPASVWGGPEDLSFSGTTMWDEENFYFMAIVTDDVFSVSYQPQEAKNMWMADNIQFGFVDKAEVSAETKGKFTEIGLAEVPGQGDIIWRYNSLYDDLPKGVAVDKENAKLSVVRYPTYTVYECAMPWSEIFYDGFKIDTSKTYRFSCMTNDSDGSGRKAWIEYTSGIGMTKDATLFGNLTFVK
ncbi:MAG: hypothetical protein J6D26_06035 [Clostridia bacterium]|nr:hypothetical protein [Clostridia bacterium]